MRTRTGWAVSLIAMPVMAATCLAAMTENWPQFRGPTGQGVSSETGVPGRIAQADLHSFGLDALLHRREGRRPVAPAGRDAAALAHRESA